MTVEQNRLARGEQGNIGSRMLLPMIVAALMGALYVLDAPDMVRFLAGGVFLVMLLFAKEETSFYMLMFILSGNEMLNFGTTSIAMIFVMLYTVKSFLLSGFRYRVIGSVIISMLALLAASAWAYVGDGESTQLITTIKLIFFLYYIAWVLQVVEDRQRLYANAFRFVAYGINFFSIVFVLFKGIPVLTERFAFHENVTINFLGITSAVTVVNLLYVNIVLKRGNTAQDVALMIGCGVWGILTQSRSFLLATGIGILLLCFLAASVKQQGKLLRGIILAVLAFAVAVAVIPGFWDRIQVVIDRIMTPSEDDVSNGRYDLWNWSISQMKRMGLTWFGAGDYTKFQIVDVEKGNVAHNFLIETWVIYGYIGCAAVIAVFAAFIRHYVFNVPKVKFKLITIVPLAVMLGALFFSHHFIGRSFTMVFILNWLPITFGTALEKGR